MVGVWYRRKLRCTREASNGGRVRVRIIHGLNISHKELIYLFQKSTGHQNQALLTCSQRYILVGKDHRLSPTATHKEDNQKNHAPTSSHNGSPYDHASGITNLNTSISTNPQLLTSMTLISPSLYLKKYARNQTSHIFNNLHESFYYIPLEYPLYQD